MKRIVGVYLDPVKSKRDLENNIDKVLGQLKETLMNDMNEEKATKLLFWLNQWSADYLKNEGNFDYKSLISYKRGNIVKANLGFRVGSEQGGLHYAVVLDNHNHRSSKVLMVVPIRSLPEDKNPEDINKDYEVFLGYGIFKDEINAVQRKIKTLSRQIEQKKRNNEDYSKEAKQLNRLNKELSSLNQGSVAQVSQCCALSKMRIYNPKHFRDKLSTFVLCEDKLGEIEEKFKELYFKNHE